MAMSNAARATLFSAFRRLLLVRVEGGVLRIHSPKVEDDMKGDHHVYPTRDLVDHDIEDGRGCWCQPRVAVPCDDCEDGCWKCDGGLVDVEAGHFGKVLVIHNAADGRE